MEVEPTDGGSVPLSTKGVILFNQTLVDCLPGLYAHIQDIGFSSCSLKSQLALTPVFSTYAAVLLPGSANAFAR